MHEGTGTDVRDRRVSRLRTVLIAPIAIVLAIVLTGSVGVPALPLVSLVIGLLIAGIGLLLLIGHRRDV